MAREDSMKVVRAAGLAIATLMLPATAAAAPPIVVGSGTADSCNEAAFLNALDIARTEGRGSIQFDCGGGPVTIVVTPTDAGGAIVLPNRTTIDGGGLVTLSIVELYLGPS